MKRNRHKKRTPAVIPDKLDFSTVFKEEGAEEEKSFEELFKASVRDTSLKKLMNEKKNNTKHQPLSKNVLLKNYPPVQATLDLHGMTEEQAIEEVNMFLNTEAGKKTKTVRIITGKGLHSENGPVLRNSIELLAVQLVRKGVLLSWKWEKKVKEKSGAAIFFIK